MQSDYTHDIAGPAVSAALAALAALDPLGHDGDRLRVAGRDDLDPRSAPPSSRGCRRPCRPVCSSLPRRPRRVRPAVRRPVAPRAGNRRDRDASTQLSLAGGWPGAGWAARTSARTPERSADPELGRLSAIRRRLHGHRVRGHRACGRLATATPIRNAPHRRVHRPDRADRARCDVHHRRVPPRADPAPPSPRAPAEAGCWSPRRS